MKTCSTQEWVFKLAAVTFAAVVLGSLAAQIYQTVTGKGQASAALTDHMKSAMLVLSGMLAASKLPVHTEDKDKPSGTEADPIHSKVDNTKKDPVITENTNTKGRE